MNYPKLAGPPTVAGYYWVCPPCGISNPRNMFVVEACVDGVHLSDGFTGLRVTDEHSVFSGNVCWGPIQTPEVEK